MSDRLGNHRGDRWLIISAYYTSTDVDAAVASQLAVYEFTLKTKPRDPTPAIALKGDLESTLNWETETVSAEVQNWARTVRLVLLPL